MLQHAFSPFVSRKLFFSRMISSFRIPPENQNVRAIEIAGGGLQARVLSHGAALQDLRLEGHPSPLVLGFTDLRDYLNHSAHHGAIAGPVINRIAEGIAVIDGTTYRFDRNDHGQQTLHGGNAELYAALAFALLVLLARVWRTQIRAHAPYEGVPGKPC